MVASVREKLALRFGALGEDHPAYPWLVMVTVLFATFIAVLDSTVVNVALPHVMAAFGSSLDSIQWVITGYLLVFAVMLPLSGWVADKFGYKRTFFAAFLFFTVGSFLCSLAWNELSLIVFRVVQGVGGGMIMPVGLAIITRAFPANKRGLAMGFWGIAAAAASSFGPGLGGFLVDRFGWPSVFLVNVPIGLVGMAAVWVVQREYRLEKSQSFDVPGFVAIAAFLVSLLLALSNGNASWNAEGWSAPFILASFVIAGASLVVFLIVEVSSPHPIVDLKLFFYPNFAWVSLLLTLFGLGLMGSTFLLPLYLQTTLGYTALQAGVALMPMGLLQALTSPISGFLADRTDPKVPLLVGLGLLVLALFLNTRLTPFPAAWQVTVPLVLMGMGFGMFFVPLQTSAMSLLPKDKIAQAGGLISLVRQIGSSFGVALVTTLLSFRQAFHASVLGEGLGAQPDLVNAAAASLGRGGTEAGLLPAVSSLVAPTQIVQQAKTVAYVQAIDDIYLLVAVSLALCVFPVLAMKLPKKGAAPGPGAV